MAYSGSKSAAVRQFHSSLPVFKIKRINQKLVKVTCPRSNCGAWHIVDARRWVKSSWTIARSCPYCSRFSRMKKLDAKT